MYVAIFDAHIGAPGWEKWYPALEHVVSTWRARGARIIWGGDTLDQGANSAIELPDIVKDDDIWLYGNHDPYPPEGVQARWHYLTEDGILVVHGDAIDFQYIAALLGRTFRGVKREHALLVYQASVLMPDSLARAIIHWGSMWLQGAAAPNWRLVMAALPYLLPALLSEPPRIFPDPKDLPMVNPLSQAPEDIEARLEAMYHHLQWQRVVMGHLHPPRPIIGERVVVSQGWPRYPNAGYVVIDGSRVYPMELNA